MSHLSDSERMENRLKDYEAQIEKERNIAN